MNKKGVWLIAAIVIFVASYFYASPYLVLNHIKTAVQAGDSDKVSTYIDYPSVRQSLKDQMNTMVMKKAEEQGGDGLSAFAAMLAAPMLDKMVNIVVTPVGMTLILQGKDLKDTAISGQLEQKSQAETLKNRTTEAQAFEKKMDYVAGYTGINNFQVVVKDEDQANGIIVKMVRKGLSWQVNEIVMPMGALIK